ncbi:hypothetical protein IMZ11_24605 [Microtetraspora sp. AC03309]|uniref:S1 family peptidase n=1 Tax=Microtetraspora sp. AC03309 TaxID=2779376 RepID=UPI001E5B5E89|nr:S1 family peptidase [Microtetraspora sp. AC03309]MCC5578812.1 hypothetical protein [Microtetraspora sp. AC03309]
MPVAVVEHEPVRATSRCDDGSPWSGGAAIRNHTSGGRGLCGPSGTSVYDCTAGFGTHIGSVKYLLTAGHCGSVGDTFTDGGGTVIGQASNKHAEHDLLLIPTDAQSRIWDGIPGVSDFTKPVVGWGWTFPGQSLCYSGAMRGANCGYTVADGEYTKLCGEDSCWTDLIAAKRRSQNVTTAKQVPWSGGDSGAPVFSLTNDSAWVQAAGTLTGVFTTSDWLGNRSEWIVFQDFGTATRDWPGLDTINYLDPI